MADSAQASVVAAAQNDGALPNNLTETSAQTMQSPTVAVETKPQSKTATNPRRRVLLIAELLANVMLSGLLFGWSSLLLIFEKEGVYKSIWCAFLAVFSRLAFRMSFTVCFVQRSVWQRRSFCELDGKQRRCVCCPNEPTQFIVSAFSFIIS